MIQEPGQLAYFISEKKISSNENSLVLVSLAGPITRSNTPFLEKLISELEQKTPTWVIIDFRAVDPHIERPVFPTVAKLQKTIRDKHADLKLCGIHPDLRKVLDDAGLLRSSEITGNLAAALQSLPYRKN